MIAMLAQIVGGNVFVSIIGVMLWMLAGMYLAAHKYHACAAMSGVEIDTFSRAGDFSACFAGRVAQTFMKTFEGTSHRETPGQYRTEVAASQSTFNGLAGYASPASLPVRGKPRVLILPNVASWIVGQMAMHIMRRFQDDYEFWFLTDKMIRLRPDLVRTLIPQLDFIFPLTDKSYKLLRAAAGPMAAATIHILAASRDHLESLDAGGGP